MEIEAISGTSVLTVRFGRGAPGQYYKSAQTYPTNKDTRGYRATEIEMNLSAVHGGGN